MEGDMMQIANRNRGVKKAMGEHLIITSREE